MQVPETTQTYKYISQSNREISLRIFKTMLLGLGYLYHYLMWIIGFSVVSTSRKVKRDFHVIRSSSKAQQKILSKSVGQSFYMGPNVGTFKRIIVERWGSLDVYGTIDNGWVDIYWKIKISMTMKGRGWKLQSLKITTITCHYLNANCLVITA